MAARKPEAKVKTGKPVAPVSKRHTKQQRMIDMLRRPGGATIPQLSKAFGREPHTERGAISGALKKKLGLSVASMKSNEGGSTEFEQVTSRVLEAPQRASG